MCGAEGRGLEEVRAWGHRWEVGACAESTFSASSFEWTPHSFTHFDHTLLEQGTVVSGIGNLRDVLCLPWLQTSPLL